MSLKDVFVIREESDADRERHNAARAKTGFWGEEAAGVIFYAEDTGRVMLGKRSQKVMEPGTWGTWGGAMNQGETPEKAARREAGEEAGVSVRKMIPIWTFKHPSGFQYHNFMAVVPSEFEPKLDAETDDAEWVTPGQWPSPLHPGVKELVKRREFTDLLYKLRNNR